MINRRTFLYGLAETLAAPRAGQAQPTPMRLAMLLTGPQAVTMLDQRGRLLPFVVC